jgi:hypothetical protein
MATRYSQTAYIGLTLSLQMESQYTLWVVPGIDAQLKRIKSAIADSFIPSLLGLDQDLTSELLCE